MSRKLSQELHEAGCDMDADAFRDSLIEQHQQAYPNWTVDELVCHPKEAIQFCDSVRSKIKGNLTDFLILRTLMNQRKNP